MNINSLNGLYAKYNRRAFVHPDPLEFLYNYKDLKDREIAGLIASALAYGRVAQILKSVGSILEKIGSSPRDFIESSTSKTMEERFKGFRHRFTGDRDMVRLLIGIKKALKKYQTLNDCFISGYSDSDINVIPAISRFIEKIDGKEGASYLLPHPSKGSACKRLNLFLRWMVRKDDVDPGGWRGVPVSKLVIPLDTHMHRIGRDFKMTERKQGDMKTALEITDAFAKISPDDPVKYDFSLTRLGIRDDIEEEESICYQSGRPRFSGRCRAQQSSCR